MSGMTLADALDLATQRLQEGKAEDAAALLARILEVSPGHRTATYLLERAQAAAQPVELGDPSSLARGIATQQRHPYFMVPPYNLNWMLPRLDRSLALFLRDNPIRVIDVGARGGGTGELATLNPFIDYVGFDADAEECRRLNATPPRQFRAFRAIPCYVGGSTGTVHFHLYRQPGQSSLREPSPRYAAAFDGDIGIARTVEIASDTLDNLATREGLAPPDLLKLDTQGTELDILRAAESVLAACPLVEVEVEFTEVYRGQALYHDIAAFLYQRGFELLYLNRVFQTRRTHAGPARGQITFGDALFGRREDALAGFDAARLARYAVLLCNYGHIDLAHAIWQGSADLQSLVPGLAALLRQDEPQGEPRPDATQMERTLFWLLHQRRSNGLPVDSDRSWPIR